MSQVIEGQVNFVVAALCNGMLLIAGYDLLRLLRWIVPHSKAWVVMEDLLYWLLASVPTYYLFFCYNEGIIRWYGLLSLLAGGVLYERGISLPIRSCLNRWASGWRRYWGQRWRRQRMRMRKKKELRRQRDQEKRKRQEEKARKRREEKEKRKLQKKKNKEREIA